MRLDNPPRHVQDAVADFDGTAACSAQYTIAQNAYWQPLLLRRSIALPDLLWEQFDRQSFTSSAVLRAQMEKWQSEDQNA